VSDNANDHGLTSIIGFSDNHHAIAREWADFQEFDPNQVLDGLIAKMRLENDAALASKLQVIQPIIRMIREGSLAMNPVLFLSWIQEATGIGANELKELINTLVSRPGR